MGVSGLADGCQNNAMALPDLARFIGEHQLLEKHRSMTTATQLLAPLLPLLCP